MITWTPKSEFSFPSSNCGPADEKVRFAFIPNKVAMVRSTNLTFDFNMICSWPGSLSTPQLVKTIRSAVQYLNLGLDFCLLLQYQQGGCYKPYKLCLRIQHNWITPNLSIATLAVGENSRLWTPRYMVLWWCRGCASYSAWKRSLEP